ncbi:hypothetical protein PHET_01076 [Paragonimus heterotremus]|uniref:Uncharacterized protein n=1 Tax=Paragonimus heterotremus TaxID=100268 RepID=A0A8J4X3A2_9TREM|nr:hypothetical protein PHET_01076 [Paragonimus heterotremus]
MSVCLSLRRLGQSSGDNIVGSLVEYASTADHPTYLYESLLNGVLLKIASSISWMLVTTLRVPEDGKSSSFVLLIKALLQLTQICRQKHEARAGTLIALKAMRILHPILIKNKGTPQLTVPEEPDLEINLKVGLDEAIKVNNRLLQAYYYTAQSKLLARQGGSITKEMQCLENALNALESCSGEVKLNVEIYSMLRKNDLILLTALLDGCSSEIWQTLLNARLDDLTKFRAKLLGRVSQHFLEVDCELNFARFHVIVNTLETFLIRSSRRTIRLPRT